MKTSKIVQLLNTSSDTDFDQIPAGKKEFVYFVANNERNLTKKEREGEKPFFR